MAFAANAAPQDDHAPAIFVRTPLQLDNGTVAEIAGFKNLSDDKEHIALIYPGNAAQTVPLVRLHSECLTGDVFGSARCDCGDQLHEAQDRMTSEGGILLYLRQEGRGIGLYPKLDAYRLQQEQGLDTFAANRHLGFEEDQRSFIVAAEMLHALGITKIRLLTNNPEKVRALTLEGIEVTEVISTGRYEKTHNRDYLETKRKHGHTL